MLQPIIDKTLYKIALADGSWKIKLQMSIRFCMVKDMLLQNKYDAKSTYLKNVRFFISVFFVPTNELIRCRKYSRRNMDAWLLKSMGNNYFKALHLDTYLH